MLGRHGTPVAQLQELEGSIPRRPADKKERKADRMNRRDIVVIGASAGGVSALSEVASALPPKFPAVVLIVLHVGSNVSLLPELLTARGANRAIHPQDGERLQTGTIYVAPPDHHMRVEGDTIRLTRGAKEHHTRPAIDPLFCSAALAGGARVIGVILTGHGDDGTAGLQAVKACGGLAVVQDPTDAEQPSMPASALRHVRIDHCVPLRRLGDILAELAGQAVEPAQQAAPPQLLIEHSVATGGARGFSRAHGAAGGAAGAHRVPR
ncbi:chemotaxis protein CheB [Piscinibacter sp.]|uniref:chemotaxis protein CheB n=1 Tax=Piscinibacter sp. TaxID=1903157 RepID=UPI002CD4B5B2|nr:chemotaxis protein CheB [Albitalea sp.]HUG24773.1 chemotaxis protein CheB [Albitalea sp.]